MYLIATRDVTRDDIAILCDEVERVFGVICEPLARCEGGLHITDWPGKVDGQDRNVRLPQHPGKRTWWLRGGEEDKESLRGNVEVCYTEGRIDILFKHFGVPSYTRDDMEKWATCFARIGIELKCWKTYWKGSQREFPSIAV